MHAVWKSLMLGTQTLQNVHFVGLHHSIPGLRRTPCVLLEQVPDFISCKRNQIECCERILQCKATAVNGDEMGIQLKKTLLIKMKMLLHIVFATSIHGIQTDCSTSSQLLGQAEISAYA